MGSIGGPSNFRSRNRSVMLQSDSDADQKFGQASRLDRIKHGQSLDREEDSGFSKTQFRRNVLSNIFGQSPKNS